LFGYNYITQSYKTITREGALKNILITGIGSGLGKALAELYHARGDRVYAIGRILPPSLAEEEHFFFQHCDLSDPHTIKAHVRPFLRGGSFDLVILNAGMLGEIKLLSETSLDEIHKVMDLNVWANKELIDLLGEEASVTQVVAMSSGAAVNGSKGWGAYALSKASLNMLLKVYAKEFPRIHFCALAPGVINTPMVRHIVEEVDEERFPSVKRLKDGPILTPRQGALRLIETFEKLKQYESGSFIDIREMD
jgi:NAD(P)-dependent dehydrogenase (short-subunit alcohol dehydrogenase family)